MTNELNYGSGFNTESVFREIPITLNPPLIISQTSAGGCTFKVPSGVYNWSKSHIDLDITVTDNATICALHLGKNMLIDNIKLTYEGAETSVVNLANARVVSMSSTLAQTKYDHFMTRTIAMQSPLPLASCGFLERCELICPIKHESKAQYSSVGAISLLSTFGNKYADLAGMGGYAIEIDQSANGATVVPGPVPGPDACATAIGKLSTGQASFNVKVRINLSDYKNTLFAMNKTIYYPLIGNLEINFTPWQKWGFSITGNNADATQATLLGSQDLSPNGATPVAISQPILWVPYEHTPEIKTACKLTTAAGLSMRIPFISQQPGQWAGGGTFAAANTATTTRFNCALTTTFGKRILRIYTVVCRTADVGVGFMDSSNCVNANGAATYMNNLYGSIRTFVGDDERQQGTLNCMNGDDYRYLKILLEGSAISSQTQFQNMSFFVDNFTNAGPSYMWDEQNSNEGSYLLVDAMGNQKQDVYSVELNTNYANAQIYFVIVGQRTMTVTTGNVILSY